MASMKSLCSAVVASAVMVGLAGCGGSSNNSSNPPPTCGLPCSTSGATTVYVVQNPMTFGSGSGTILQFSASASGSVSPTATITAPTNTSYNEVASDGAGNVYTSYYGPMNVGGVVEYAAGSTGSAAFLRSLPANTTTGVTAVDGVATNAAGEIFVAEDYGGVQAFSATATGSVVPSRRILGASETGGGLSTIGVADAIAADSSDNLYILNQGLIGGQPLLVFGPTATGNVAPIRSIGGALTNLSMGSVVGVATDAAGNLYVTTFSTTNGQINTLTGSILEFAPGANGNVAPIRTISGASTQLIGAFGIAVDSVGNIFVVTASTAAFLPTVLKFSAGASGNVAPTSSFTSSSWTNPDFNATLAVH